MKIRVVSNVTGASVSSTKLRASVAFSDPTAVVAVQLPVGSIQYIQLVVGVSAVAPSADVSYIQPTVSAYLDESGRYKYLADMAAVVDAAVIDFYKTLLDAASTADSAMQTLGKHVFDTALAIDSSTLVDGIEYGFQKRSTETLAVADAYLLGTLKPQSDASYVEDLYSAEVAKPVGDTAQTSDSFSRVVSYSRTPADTSIVVDVRASAYSLFDPGSTQRYVTPGYVAAEYTADDSIFTANSLSFNLQNYVSGDYFLESYVGASYGPY